MDFRNNIVVRKGVGVVGFKFGRVRKLLSEDDFAKVLSMFGIDAKKGYWGFSNDLEILAKLGSVRNHFSSISSSSNGDDEQFEDHKGYYCSVTDPHTCKVNPDCICLSGC
jgi:hypothetical protein